MSSAPRFIPRYTIDDYRQWEGSWELIDGIAVAMTPSPFAPHERVISRLSRMIGVQCDKLGYPCEVYTNLDWIVDRQTVVRPDLMVVCGRQPDQHLECPPAIAVEVLSVATRVRDQNVKRDLYLENRVAHYLIIDPENRTIQHITAAGESAIQAHESTDLIFCDNCTIRIDCRQLFD